MKVIKVRYLQYVTYALLVLIASVVILQYAKFILAPLVISVFIATALLPLLKFIQRIVKSNTWSVIILTLLTIIVFGCIGLIIYLQLQNFTENTSLSEGINKAVLQAKKGFAKLTGIKLSQLDKFLKGNGKEMIASGSEGAASLFGGLLDVLSYLFLIPLYIFLLLLYRKSINERLDTILSRFYLKYKKLADGFSTLIQNYLKGLMLVVLFMGLLNSLGLWILNVPYAFALGFFVAVFSIIPYFGAYFGGAVVLLISYASQGSLTTLLLIVALFVVIQFIEGNFLTPAIMGNKLNVNPLAALLALFVGAQIWGIVGMILAIPMLASITLFFDQFKDDLFYEKEGSG